MASARGSRVPGAEGDEDLLLAPEAPDHYQEGIGEEDSRLARAAGNRHRAVELVARDDCVEVMCVTPGASIDDGSTTPGFGNLGQVAGKMFEEGDHIVTEVSRIGGHVGDGDLRGYCLLGEDFGELDFGLKLRVIGGEGELHGCDIEFQGHAELSVRVGERGKDGDVGFYGGRFGGDVSRGHHVGLQGVWFLAGRVVNDREGIADGAAMMVRLDEAQAVAVERFGVLLDRGEEKPRRSVRC